MTTTKLKSDKFLKGKWLSDLLLNTLFVKLKTSPKEQMASKKHLNRFELNKYSLLMLKIVELVEEEKKHLI